MFKHGLSGHYLNKTYYALRARCENPNHPEFIYYGAKGIKCLFNTFIEFHKYILENLGERPEGFSLDRIDSYGNYEPGNLRWATSQEQILNQRVRKGKNSKYRGVWFCKKENTFKFQLRIANGKRISGNSKNETDAAEAYLQKYFELHKKWPPEYKQVPLCYKSPLLYKGAI